MRSRRLNDVLIDFSGCSRGPTVRGYSRLIACQRKRAMQQADGTRDPMTQPVWQPATDDSRPSTTRRRGFSLAELVLVLLVLAILAAMVVPMLDGMAVATPYGEKTPQQIATEQTMQQVRQAIMGNGSRGGAWADLGQRPEMFALFANPNVLLSETAPPGLPTRLQNFDPLTGLGWRGPYLTGPTFLLDGWGNPLIVQIDFNGNGLVDDFELRYARIVSAGPDGMLQTPMGPEYAVPGATPGNHLTLEACGDDVVLFFRCADARQ